MRFQHLLDSVPVVGILVLFAIIALIASELGYRLGHGWQVRTADEKQGATGMITGSLLALMAFLLATTMGMATDRFDKRNDLVLIEANAVNTTYLRAGYLPEPASSEVRDLLREYVPLRTIGNADMADVRARMSRSAELHTKLWSITEELARSTPQPANLSLFMVSLNEMINLHETRVAVGIYGRVPATILLLLLFGSTMTLSMVGFNAGLSQRRSNLSTAVLILVLGAVITLVVDLDRSREGFVKVNQQPLIDLQEQIGSLPSTSASLVLD